MTGQDDGAGPTFVQAEPVVVAEAVRGVLVAVVAAGWLIIPDSTIAVIVSGVGLLGSIVSTIFARRRVSPVATGRDQ
ncbi:hypothetical protein SD37_11810 [Amycolatopsis orientalis]|uniref:Uncharacterized protein n=1 Tax=Amycolatopsis orientalis TaxID=31958 RepID=A0A193BVR8_AMYOR|nr:hypothetical protein [Amycolatopsis orientalis]ANN16264.1 hypothetical protein SD37_11810 [Amycolatopsis orientalis]